MRPRASAEWCYTDRPGDVPGFIAERDRLKDQTVKVITPDRAWDQGVPRLNSLVGGQWQGQPIWGEASSTWLKLRVV